MKKKELEQKIKELESRIEALETSRCSYVYHFHYPSYPGYDSYSITYPYTPPVYSTCQ